MLVEGGALQKVWPHQLNNLRVFGNAIPTGGHNLFRGNIIQFTKIFVERSGLTPALLVTLAIFCT